MNPLSADEFGKALHSESGLTVSPIAIGFVRKTTDPHVIEFSPTAALCHVWIKIPLKMIDKVQVLGKFPCLDHVHDFVILFFKKPESPEAAVFAELLHHESKSKPALSMATPHQAALDTPFVAARGNCARIYIYSNVGGVQHLIHFEMVTDPDLEKKIYQVLSSWSALPGGFNRGVVTNC